VFGVLYAYRAVFMVVGLFCTKKYAPAKKHHRFAIVIAARNEEAVIGHLLDSIARQDYPAEALTTFVVADNCTDATARVAREHGAVCYERFDNEHCTKGYALQFLFEQIERDWGHERFEGYFIFDADNLLMRDYISRMNDAFDAGESVVVSYRNTKNIGDGWLSAGYGLHWLRTCRLEHCGRSALGISARIQGTGALFASKYVQNGWHYTSLTEDRAFSSDIVAEGERIAYQHAAQFYDEQPTSLFIAMRQRLRWAKGNLQAFTETGWGLLCGIFTKRGAAKRISCYDMLLFNLPGSVVTVPAKLIKAGLVIAAVLMGSDPSPAWYFLLYQIVQILIFEHFAVIPMAFLIFFTERRRMTKLRWYQYVWYALMFPIFGIIGDLVMLLAVFVRVQWKPIPHNASIRIGELEMHENANVTDLAEGAAPSEGDAASAREPESAGKK
jgi:cellulose synthase/poly-beta-1,6-N-acetylglucosamine synthase-like glycosyltransferase